MGLHRYISPFRFQQAIQDQRECDSQERKVHPNSVSYLGGLSVGGLLGGHVLLPGEPDAEHPQGVAVGGLDIDVALDQRLPLLDHGPQLVRGQAHPVEICQAVLALEKRESSRFKRPKSIIISHLYWIQPDVQINILRIMNLQIMSNSHHNKQ